MPSAVFFQVATRKPFVVRELPEKSVHEIGVAFVRTQRRFYFLCSRITLKIPISESKNNTAYLNI